LNRKNTIKILIIFCSILMSQACNKGNCNGVDRIYELSALKVYTKDTVQYTPRTTSTVFTLNFSLRDEYSTTKGTRSCRHKDLAVEHKNAWDENTLSFKCNKDFYSKSKLFLANTELKDAAIVDLKINKDQVGGLVESSILIYDIDSINASDDYEFTISLSTTDNKIFSTKTNVFIKK